MATRSSSGSSSRLAWADFARAAPELAEAGRRLLVGSDGVAIGFLATVSAQGRPHLAPVCPIFCADDLHLCVAARTPKARDLMETGAYVLHAVLGENDEEFQVAGRAERVEAAAARAAVHEAIPFPSFDRADPIFRLDVARALHVHWERPGQPGTRPVRRHWRAQGGRTLREGTGIP